MSYNLEKIYDPADRAHFVSLENRFVSGDKIFDNERDYLMRILSKLFNGSPKRITVKYFKENIGKIIELCRKKMMEVELSEEEKEIVSKLVGEPGFGLTQKELEELGGEFPEEAFSIVKKFLNSKENRENLENYETMPLFFLYKLHSIIIRSEIDPEYSYARNFLERLKKQMAEEEYNKLIEMTRSVPKSRVWQIQK